MSQHLLAQEMCLIFQTVIFVTNTFTGIINERTLFYCTWSKGFWTFTISWWNSGPPDKSWVELSQVCRPSCLFSAAQKNSVGSKLLIRYLIFSCSCATFPLNEGLCPFGRHMLEIFVLHRDIALIKPHKSAAYSTLHGLDGVLMSASFPQYNQFSSLSSTHRICLQKINVQLQNETCPFFSYTSFEEVYFSWCVAFQLLSAQKMLYH